jgi:hypothetical protein
MTEAAQDGAWRMTAALRAVAILVHPRDTWQAIDRESGDPVYLLSRYVAVLALIPALFGFIGVYLIGAAVPEGTVRATLFDGLFGALFGYALSFALILLLGFAIDLVAPLFGAAKNFESALKLAVYSYTPVWLAGVFLLLAGLRFLTLTSLYGACLLLLGLPRLMKSPEAKTTAFALAIAGCAIVLTLLAAAAQRAVFPTAGLLGTI